MCPWNECSVLRHGDCFFPLLVNKFPFASFTVWRNYNKKEDMRKLALLYNQLLICLLCCWKYMYFLHPHKPSLAVFRVNPRYSQFREPYIYTEAPALLSRLLAHFLHFPGGCLELGLSAKSRFGHFPSC